MVLVEKWINYVFHHEAKVSEKKKKKKMVFLLYSVEFPPHEAESQKIIFSNRSSRICHCSNIDSSIGPQCLQFLGKSAYEWLARSCLCTKSHKKCFNIEKVTHITLKHSLILLNQVC